MTQIYADSQSTFELLGNWMMRKTFPIFFLWCALSAQAATYDVRRANVSTSYAYHVGGPDLEPDMVAGNSFFMGLHFKFLQWNAGSAQYPLVTVSSSTTGAHRYLRLHVEDTDKELKFQARERGDAGNGSRDLDHNVTVSTNLWYAAGVWVEYLPGGTQWRFTTYLRRHGGTLTTATKTVSAMDYSDSTMNLFSVMRHAFYSGGINSAHQTYADFCQSLWIKNPTGAEIEMFMAVTDPSDIWSTKILVRPLLSDWSDAYAGGYWITGGTAPSLNGTLTFETNARLLPLELGLSQRVTIGITGHPGRTYRIQWSPNFDQWSDFAPVTTDGTGLGSYAEASVPAPGNRYFRILWP